MAKSQIEWTEATWNPVTGCDRVSAGCDHCYALTLAKRLKAMGAAKYQTDGDPRTSGPGFGLTLHPQVLTEPYRWRGRQIVFVNSMSACSWWAEVRVKRLFAWSKRVVPASATPVAHRSDSGAVSQRRASAGCRGRGCTERGAQLRRSGRRCQSWPLCLDLNAVEGLADEGRVGFFFLGFQLQLRDELGNALVFVGLAGGRENGLEQIGELRACSRVVLSDLVGVADREAARRRCCLRCGWWSGRGRWFCPATRRP